MDAEEIILEKTFNLLLLKGFDAVSITDIQKTTNLSRGLLYHYFKNKEDLFIKVTEKYFVEIFDFDLRRTKDHNAFEFVTFICDRFNSVSSLISDIIKENNDSSHPSILNYHFLFYQVMQRDIIFRNNYRTITEKEHTAWEYSLNNSIYQNQIRKNIDTGSSAKQLFILTDGIWFQSIFSTDGKGIVKNLESTLLHYLELLK